MIFQRKQELVSGIAFISNKKRCNLNKEQEEEFRDIAKTIKEKIRIDDFVSVDYIEKAIGDSSKSKIHNMLLQLAYSDKPVKILKGAVDVILDVLYYSKLCDAGKIFKISK